MRVLALLALVVLSTEALNADRERPVQKVIGMLNEMKTELQAEADADEEMYDKMTCYCDSNTKEKTKAVADAEARITELTSLIEGKAAKSATAATEISTLQGEVSDNTAALEKAGAIRSKENAEFTEDEKNMAEGIEGLRGAVDSLSKHHGAFTQESFLALKSKLHLSKTEMEKIMLKTTKAKKVFSFLQKQNLAPTNSGSYSSQSGEIFGILKQMKEGFETNLNDAKNEESTSSKTFADLKASKTAELNAANTAIQTKQTEKAEADEAGANGKTDLADTQASLAADNEFLANLKVECDNFAAEYAERTKTRSEEQAAVSEVIGMLTDDDAHDLFSRTYTSFVQIKAHRQGSSRVSKAAKLLLDSGKKLDRPSMVALAVSMRAGLDNFSNVKDKVEKMIADLMAEKGEEIKVMDKCRAELKENADATEDANDRKADLETNIADLTNTITNLKDSIANLNQEIAETRIGMKRASEDREAENKEFQATVADQRATQAILTKAMDRLKEFYGSQALVQTSKAAAPAGMKFGGGNGYQKNLGGGNVMMMINGVIKDAEQLEKESLQAEQEAQTAYEQLVTDSNNLINAKQEDIASKSGVKGAKEGELVVAEGDLKSTNTDLEALSGINNSLHLDCDFLLNNYDIRQEARDQEVESLKLAVAMLSGAEFK